jgi:hypothetical protein
MHCDFLYKLSANFPAIWVENIHDGRQIITLVRVFRIQLYFNICEGRFGDVVVSVLSTGPKGKAFKPGRGNGFLRAIKVGTASIG